MYSGDDVEQYFAKKVYKASLEAHGQSPIRLLTVHVSNIFLFVFIKYRLLTNYQRERLNSLAFKSI